MDAWRRQKRQGKNWKDDQPENGRNVDLNTADAQLQYEHQPHHLHQDGQYDGLQQHGVAVQECFAVCAVDAEVRALHSATQRHTITAPHKAVWNKPMASTP